MCTPGSEVPGYYCPNQTFLGLRTSEIAQPPYFGGEQYATPISLWQHDQGFFGGCLSVHPYPVLPSMLFRASVCTHTCFEAHP